jgi:hypothetical protein
MLFRSRRSSSGAVSPRQSPSFAATVGNFAPSGPTAFERPSSAPVAGAVPLQQSSSTPVFANAKADEVRSVEDRLNIIKRSRTASSAKTYVSRDPDSSAPVLRPPDMLSHSVDPSPSDFGGQNSTVAPRVGVAPPCSSYPTFSLAKLPKHEQHIMDALLNEFTEVLFFPQSGNL